MQRYHDASRDPLPIRSPYHDQERLNIAKATEEFLAKGGQIEQVGHQMQATSPTFVINPTRTPVYAHLFVRPEDEPVRAKPAVKPNTAPAKPEIEAEAPAASPEQAAAPRTDIVQELRELSIAARLMVQAALGASPSIAARAIGISEKQARQVARDFHITFKRQR
ncbi:hypothetical protein CDR19_25335 [Ectopseudomonas toyotomiensis]|uniref:Uncharacterized protein n=1 Tax=Ectopseudomonas toyotomiensis TaxID=554344 RepID=A0A1I5Z5X4_9GAMM|nr:hypothetical protein [Pseudomonas toyotomiensis]PIA66343.1 hypothetical protein CDR19_25335 [Pseudomonas toyotomiensis]SFQ51863.1 hypothetical protein SAMN05216177_1287 [Pseudomonas toyotomiensis]